MLIYGLPLLPPPGPPNTHTSIASTPFKPYVPYTPATTTIKPYTSSSATLVKAPTTIQQKSTIQPTHVQSKPTFMTLLPYIAIGGGLLTLLGLAATHHGSSTVKSTVNDLAQVSTNTVHSTPKGAPSTAVQQPPVLQTQSVKAQVSTNTVHSSAPSLTVQQPVLPVQSTLNASPLSIAVQPTISTTERIIPKLDPRITHLDSPFNIPSSASSRSEPYIKSLQPFTPNTISRSQSLSSIKNNHKMNQLQRATTSPASIDITTQIESSKSIDTEILMKSQRSKSVPNSQSLALERVTSAPLPSQFIGPLPKLPSVPSSELQFTESLNVNSLDSMSSSESDNALDILTESSLPNTLPIASTQSTVPSSLVNPGRTTKSTTTRSAHPNAQNYADKFIQDTKKKQGFPSSSRFQEQLEKLTKSLLPKTTAIVTPSQSKQSVTSILNPPNNKLPTTLTEADLLQLAELPSSRPAGPTLLNKEALDTLDTIPNPPNLPVSPVSPVSPVTTASKNSGNLIVEPL